MGANDGGIKRGDREDTGDNQVQSKDGVSEAGSGVRAGMDGAGGNPTAVAHSTELNRNTNRGGDVTEDGLTILDEDDPSLGLGDGPEG